VFTDAAWAVWEPLIEEVRPHGKTPPKELRRTISAIFWRHQNGAKWRAIPAELGPWWLAPQLFIRWVGFQRRMTVINVCAAIASAIAAAGSCTVAYMQYMHNR
jgi:transposase